MKVAFITDGGLKMGMGHVYRCLTLAEEIKNAAEIYFLTKEGTKIVVNKISVHGYMVSKLKSDKEIIEKIRKIKPDVVVIDKPVIDINFTKVLKNNLNIERLVLFDSPSKANMYADVVVNAIIDSNFENKKYIDKITNTLYFYGPRYLTLRKMFYKYKNKKDRINDIKNILLTFGGSDPSNLTCKGYIIGCSMLIRREVLDKLKGFDEKYFCCWEEIDLCVICKKLGYKLFCSPRSILWHKVAVSSGGDDSSVKVYYNTRNWIYFVKKHNSFYNYLIFLIWFLGYKHIRRIVYFIFLKKKVYLLKYFYIGIWDGVVGKYYRRGLS